MRVVYVFVSVRIGRSDANKNTTNYVSRLCTFSYMLYRVHSVYSSSRFDCIKHKTYGRYKKKCHTYDNKNEKKTQLRSGTRTCRTPWRIIHVPSAGYTFIYSVSSPGRLESLFNCNITSYPSRHRLGLHYTLSNTKRLSITIRLSVDGVCVFTVYARGANNDLRHVPGRFVIKENVLGFQFIYYFSLFEIFTFGANSI